MAKYGLMRFICRKSAFLSPEQIEDYRKDGIVVVDRFHPKLRKGNDDNANAGNASLLVESHFYSTFNLLKFSYFQSLDRPRVE